MSGLSSLLAFNSGMAGAFKVALKNRDHALSQYTKATELLDSRSKERQKWQQSGGASPRVPSWVRAGGHGDGAACCPGLTCGLPSARRTSSAAAGVAGELGGAAQLRRGENRRDEKRWEEMGREEGTRGEKRRTEKNEQRRKEK